MRRLITVAFVVAAATATSRSDADGGGPTSGLYENGRDGTAHYLLTVSPSSSGGQFSGAVTMLYQDGQTALAFTFTGAAQSGVATLSTSSGRVISAVYGDRTMQLSQCPAYLQWAQSLAECNFTLSHR